MTSDTITVVCSECQRPYHVPSNTSGFLTCGTCGEKIPVNRRSGDDFETGSGQVGVPLLIGSGVGIVALGIVVALVFSSGSPSSSNSASSPEPVVAKPKKQAVPIVQKNVKQQAKEGEAIKFRPTVTNRANFERGLHFSAVSELPKGCVLDKATGELRWTPSEVQGPQNYELRLRVAEPVPGGASSDFQVVINVEEVNQPPTFDPALDHSVVAGETLVVPLSAKDDDFPPNDVVFQLESGAATGAKIDVKTQTLRWKVPADHGRKSIPIVVRATDSGSPNKSIRVTFNVEIAERKVAAPAAQLPPRGNKDSVVSFQVGLPSPLPRELKEVVPTDLTKSDRKLQEALSKSKSWRAALTIPQSLQGQLKTRYTDETFSTFVVDVLGASRTDKQKTERLDGAVAMCSVVNGRIEWVWEASKSTTVRSLQNNLRDCLLELVSEDRQTTLTIGLTAPVEIVFGLNELFAKPKLQSRATRLDRRARVFSLLSDDLVLDYGRGQAKLTAVAAKTANAVTFESAALARDLGLQSVGLIIRSRNNEYQVELVSKPSLLSRKNVALASRKQYLRLINDQKQWARRLNQAIKDYNRALTIPTNTKVNRDARASGLRDATVNANKAKSRLNDIGSKIPIAERTMEKTRSDLDSLLGRFTAIKNARMTGQMFLKVNRSRVLVMRFVTQVAPVPNRM